MNTAWLWPNPPGLVIQLVAGRRQSGIRQSKRQFGERASQTVTVTSSGSGRLHRHREHLRNDRGGGRELYAERGVQADRDG